MTPEQLNEITARHEAATPGPWKHDDGDTWGDYSIYAPNREFLANIGGPIQVIEIVSDTDKANAEFIAHARQDIPNLVTEVKRLAAERDTWKNDVEGLEDRIIKAQHERDLSQKWAQRWKRFAKHEISQLLLWCEWFVKRQKALSAYRDEWDNADCGTCPLSNWGACDTICKSKASMIRTIADIAAERDQWKRKAKVMESVLWGKCYYCVNGGGFDAPREFALTCNAKDCQNADHWQFDEARFAPKEEE